MTSLQLNRDLPKAKALSEKQSDSLESRACHLSMTRQGRSSRQEAGYGEPCRLPIRPDRTVPIAMETPTSVSSSPRSIDQRPCWTLRVFRKPEFGLSC